MDSRIRENPERTIDLVIQVSCPPSEHEDPSVLWSFPQDLPDQEVIQTIPKFCFPFDVERAPQTQVGQNFTFVLTDIDGKQRFGFCRLTQGCRVCLCLLSYLPWFEIFYKLLNTLADYLAKQQENELQDLLKSLYGLPVPTPYTPVNLSVHSYFIAPDIHGLPTIPESRNLTEYFVAVDVNNMLQLYGSMLHERRIIITSSKLSTLTACVHGAAALLFPMFWQHIFIPVLPPHLLDYCCAPMPYFVGVHLSLLERVRSRSLEDVVILNVDTNALESPFDDLHHLPSDVVSSLKSKLKKQSTATGSGVSRAFLRAQAALFGTYRDALRYKPGEPITFCEESFINHRSSTMRSFLTMAVNLQLFKQFIDGRLAKLNAGRGFSDVFEEEITEGGFCGSNSRHYQQWMHTVKRGGAFLNTAVTKAKSHAKRGIRDIKGRLRAREDEDEVLTVCGGSPTSTKSLSPRRLHKIRRQRLNKSPMSLCPRELGHGLDDDDSASKISSEDSADVRSYTEDSDDSLSLDLDLDSSSAGQMNLLEEILDSLTTSTAGEQGKLSAAKSLDFFRSMEELDYSGPLKSKPCSDSRPSEGDEDEGGWNMGQDDSVVHGKHLPPSPRRQPTKSSLKSSKKPPLSNSSTAPMQSSPVRTLPTQSSPVRIPAPTPHQQDQSRSLPRTPPRYQPLSTGRHPHDRYSYCPTPPLRATPPSRSLSGRSRTASDPPEVPPGLLRRRDLTKDPATGCPSNADSSPVRSPAPQARSPALQVPWEKEQGRKDGILGLCLGQGAKGASEAGAQVQGLLEEMGCCISSDAQSGLKTAHHPPHQAISGKTGSDE